MNLLPRFSTLVYKMLRVRTALLLLLFVAIADAVSKDVGTSYSPRLLLVLSALAAWYVFGTSVNDLADEEIDKINLKGNANRPLVNKQTSRRSLWLLSAGGAAAVIGFSALLSAQAALVGIGALALSYLYSMPPVHISYRGIWAPLMLPLGYVAYPYYLVFTANRATMDTNDMVLLAILYVSFIGRIILKDFRDVKGDTRFGKRTFIVRHGAKATCAVSAAAWILGFALVGVRFTDQPLLVVTMLPFIAGVLYFLRMLSRTTVLQDQIALVGLIGRLSNGSALLILAAVYAELNPDRTGLYAVLLVGLMAFNLQLAYNLYTPYFRRPAG